MDNKTRIEQAKQRVERAKTARTVAETQKANAEQQVEEVKGEMQKLGVTPETAEAEIQRLDQTIDESLTKAEQLLPGA